MEDAPDDDGGYVHWRCAPDATPCEEVEIRRKSAAQAVERGFVAQGDQLDAKANAIAVAHAQEHVLRELTENERGGRQWLERLQARWLRDGPT